MNRAARAARLAALLADPAVLRANEWSFLHGWFMFLSDMGASCDRRDKLDDVRVGRDASDTGGAWLELSFGRDQLDPQDDADSDDSDDGFLGSEQEWLKKPVVRERLRRAREAIILTSIVAKVDFASWLTIARDEIYLDLPAHWLVPDETGRQPQIGLQYRLRLDTQNDMAFLDWTATLRHLLGTHEYSAEYQAALEQVRDVLARRGIAWESIAPTPLIIRLTLNGHGYVVGDVRGRLLRLAEAVQRTQHLERQVDTTRTWRGALLTIYALDIDLVRSEFHDHVLEGLMAVLHAGVTVDYLRLPPLRSQLPSFATWSTFVRLLLGVDPDDHGRLASVRRIVVPAQYAGVFHFAPFCSALAYARGVDVVEFEGARHPDGTPAFGPEGTAYRDHTWRWLALALLSRASQSSVTRLVLDGERPLVRDAATIETMMNSASPLLALYAASFTQDEPQPVPVAADTLFASTPIVIPKWTVFHNYDGDRGTADCQSTRDLAGQRLATHPTTGDALVFVPGYGFCVVLEEEEHAEPSPKRAKASAVSLPVRSAFESIVLKPDVQLVMAAAALEKLVRVIGPRLRSLGFTVDCRDATLRAMLAACPNLHSVAISAAHLDSLDVFEAAYTNGDSAQLTSLSLSHVVVPEDAALAFVRRLADNENAMAKTLERLHWRVEIDSALDRLDRSTIAQSEFRDVLARNPTLTHLTGVLFDVETFHGKRMPGRSRRHAEQLLAFLSAMQTLSGYPLDELVRRRVWEFAEEQRYRCVVGPW